jgi:hypothetical protein
MPLARHAARQEAGEPVAQARQHSALIRAEATMSDKILIASRGAARRPAAAGSTGPAREARGDCAAR